MGDVLEFDSPDGVEQCWKAQTFPAQESSSASPGPQFPTDKTIICVQLYCIAFNVSFLFVVVLHIKAFFLPTFRFNECCALPIRQRLVNFVYILSMAVLAASALDVMSSPESLDTWKAGSTFMQSLFSKLSINLLSPGFLCTILDPFFSCFFSFCPEVWPLALCSHTSLVHSWTANIEL